MTLDASFLAPRRCIREPIPEIWTAAEKLMDAVKAHCAGDRIAAERLIREADIPEIAAWTASLWGACDRDIHRIRVVADAPPNLPRLARPLPRMPTPEICREVLSRDGHYCQFCGIPVIAPAIRARVRRIYPQAVRWTRFAADQHAAFQAMWLQFDHLLPNSRGGSSDADNIIITCAPCNYGRMEHIVEEMGLINPR